jgi:hypothetical protein
MANQQLTLFFLRLILPRLGRNRRSEFDGSEAILSQCSRVS